MARVFAREARNDLSYNEYCLHRTLNGSDIINLKASSLHAPGALLDAATHTSLMYIKSILENLDVPQVAQMADDKFLVFL